MSINLGALKRAVARWETYEDRGIAPHHGWGEGGDGNSCALGDIAHYEQIDTECSLYRREAVLSFALGRGPTSLDQNMRDNPICAMAVINDMYGRWPIAEAKRLIEWEEAALASMEQETAETLVAVGA